MINSAPETISATTIKTPYEFLSSELFAQYDPAVDVKTISAVEANLAFPEAVSILASKVVCLKGGHQDDHQSEGSSFEGFEKLAILDAISRTINGDIELANQLGSIMLFDDDFKQSLPLPSSAAFALVDGISVIAITKETSFDAAPEGTFHIIQYMAKSASHESQHFKQWSEGRLTPEMFDQIHQHTKDLVEPYKEKVTGVGFNAELNEKYLSKGIGHPLEVEAEEEAIRVYSEMTYLHTPSI